MKKIILLSLLSSIAFAKPHWHQEIIPQDSSYHFNKSLSDFKNWRKQNTKVNYKRNAGSENQAIRVTVGQDGNGKYFISESVLENSGTKSLAIRALKDPKYGSFKGKLLVDGKTYYDAVGTGQLYRKLVNGISFRFPNPQKDFLFQISAENPLTGEQENVLTENVVFADLKKLPTELQDVEVFKIRTATKFPATEMVIYADGFKTANKNRFFQAANRTVDTLVQSKFPGIEHMNFTAVFASSNLELGRAYDFGLPVQVRDSAFGLYYPYWEPFGRWYHIVYPTDENKFRRALSVVPYDHNIMLLDSGEYWGVGNYKSLTAIPIDSYSFNYLLLHEIGHYFGLNEEYDGGGRTELEFAPQIKDVWSQNMSLLSKNLAELKWNNLVSDKKTPIPTPNSFWGPNKFGAYAGGYADSVNSNSETYKPGLSCIMDRGNTFCPICTAGIQDVINFELGL